MTGLDVTGLDVTGVRPATAADGATLQTIERRAGERFREVGLPEVADDEPFSLDFLAEFARDGRSWVATDDRRCPIGYVLAEVVDGATHIAQVSVDPDHQGSGVGRALIDRAAAWGRSRGCTHVTLTTFADVPWNRPLYEHLGFRVLAPEEIGPELAEVMEREAAEGLENRVAMTRPMD